MPDIYSLFAVLKCVEGVSDTEPIAFLTEEFQGGGGAGGGGGEESQERCAGGGQSYMANA